MASGRRSRTILPYHTVLTMWFVISGLTLDTFGQEVTFRPQDEVNDVIIFEQETNVKLVCEADDFPEDAVIEILHDGFGLITGQGLSASHSENFTVEALDKSTILTIKEVSDLTDGRYTCTVVVSNADPVSVIFDLVMIPRFESPQCYSSATGPITEGNSFYADCFYEDVGTANAKWIQIGKDASESDVGSTEIALEGKFRRRLAIPAILVADDGVAYKCILDRMVGAITVPTSDCAIGPLEVKAIASTAGDRTTSSSTTASPAEESHSTSATSATSEQRGVNRTAVTNGQPTGGSLNEPFSLEEYLLYIIIGAVAVVVILFILCGICICCCSRKSGGKSSGDLERGKTFSPEVNGNPIPVPDYDQMPYQSKQRNGSIYYDKPPPTGVPNQGYDDPKEAEANRYSITIPGPDDMASTHL